MGSRIRHIGTKFLACMVLVGLIYGCSPTGEQKFVESEDALASYLRNPAHGLVRVHTYDELVWKVTMVPRSVENEPMGVNEPTKIQKNGIGNFGIESDVNGLGTLHLMVNITAGITYRTGDVMMAGVANFNEYADRMIQMNFRLEENARLHVGGKVLAPKLCHMENTFGLTNDRNIHMIFADEVLLPELNALPKLDLVIEDWVFGTGISHFVFQKDNLEKIPLLKI